MKTGIHRTHPILACLLVFAMACHAPEDGQPEEIKPVALVKVGGVGHRDMEEQVQLTASSVYLQRSLVVAPMAGYLRRADLKFGDAVTRGQQLYTMETRERRAIGKSAALQDTTLENFGIVSITAPVSGVITQLDRQQAGEYLLEGNPLCTITKSQDLAFQLNVPFEYHAIVQRNRRCEIVLPDQSRLAATILKPLSAMNPLTQTQLFLVKPVENRFLPEGLVAAVRLSKRTSKNTQVVPVEALLSDELLQHFWVMRLINDSTAVKVAVQPGIRTSKEVEILRPVFAAEDRLLTEGNYGLADTAFVKVLK